MSFPSSVYLFGLLCMFWILFIWFSAALFSGFRKIFICLCSVRLWLVLHRGVLMTSLLPTFLFLFLFLLSVVSSYLSDCFSVVWWWYMHVCFSLIVDMKSGYGTVSCMCLSWSLILSCVWIFRSVLEYGCWYHVSFRTRGSLCSWWWRWGIFHSSHTKMTLYFPFETWCIIVWINLPFSFSWRMIVLVFIVSGWFRLGKLWTFPRFNVDEREQYYYWKNLSGYWSGFCFKCIFMYDKF